MKKFRKNNKGFSLVELIIVIAIMAALIAILAPQYLKYVERSRISADQTTLDEVVGAVEITAGDPDISVPNTGVVLTWNVSSGNATFVPTAAGETAIETAVKTALGNSGNFTLKSASGKALTGTITVTITASTYDVVCNVPFETWS